MPPEKKPCNDCDKSASNGVHVRPCELRTKAAIRQAVCSCGDDKTIAVYGCELFVECVLLVADRASLTEVDRDLAGHKSCEKCESRKPPKEIDPATWIARRMSLPKIEWKPRVSSPAVPN